LLRSVAGHGESGSVVDCGLLTTVCVIGGTFRTPVESELTGKAAASFKLDVAQPNVLVASSSARRPCFFWA
jgi:hypothetical protein